MNILFVTNKNINPTIGGVERSTETLASAFAKYYGHKCHSAYTQRVEAEPWPYGEEFLLTKGCESNLLSKIIQDTNIDVVITQGSDNVITRLVKDIRIATNTKKGCRFVFSFRGMPGFEIANPLSKVVLFRILHGQRIIYNTENLLIGLLNPLLPNVLLRFFEE